MAQYYYKYRRRHMQNAVKITSSDSVFNNFEACIAQIDTMFNLTQEEKKALEQPVPRLLYALPFFAGCKNPSQLAVTKLGMYIMGKRNPESFYQRKNQTIRERIQIGTVCPDGDPVVIDLITTFLELISINDCINDLDNDRETNHPNAVNDNPVYYYNRREQLIDAIEKADSFIVKDLMWIVDPLAWMWW